MWPDRVPPSLTPPALSSLFFCRPAQTGKSQVLCPPVRSAHVAKIDYVRSKLSRALVSSLDLVVCSCPANLLFVRPCPVQSVIETRLQYQGCSDAQSFPPLILRPASSLVAFVVSTLTLSIRWRLGPPPRMAIRGPCTPLAFCVCADLLVVICLLGDAWVLADRAPSFLPIPPCHFRSPFGRPGSDCPVGFRAMLLDPLGRLRQVKETA